MLKFRRNKDNKLTVYDQFPIVNFPLIEESVDELSINQRQIDQANRLRKILATAEIISLRDPNKSALEIIKEAIEVQNSV